MTIYEQKGFLFKTIAAMLIVTLIVIGTHTYYNMTIQAQKFSDDWGRSLEIGKGENSWSPLIGSVDKDILTATFNKDGSLNYFLLETNGKLIDSGTIEKDKIKITSKWNVDIEKNKLFYIEDDKLYMSSFNKGEGFSNPSVIMDNLKKFQVDIVNDKIIIQGYNEENVFISEIVNNKAENIVELESDWDIYKVIYQEVDGVDKVFVVNKDTSTSVEVLEGIVEDGSIKGMRKVSDKLVSLNASLNDFEITELGDKYYILYESTQVAGGARSVYADIRSINKDTLEEESKNYIMPGDIEGVSELGEDYILFNDNTNVSVISTGRNLRNKYAVKPDVYEIEVLENGDLGEVEFISNTEAFSINPSMISLNGERYLIFLDIITGGEFALNINSTNTEYKEASSGYTEKDYKQALVKAISAPFYALSYIMMTTGIVTIIYVAFIFLGLLGIMKLLRVRNEKIKFIVFLVAYIMINLILFDNNFYTPTAHALMPDMLKLTTMRYSMPILINLISGLILYVFYRERSRYEFLTYVMVFVMIDIYLSNLIYVPFEVMKSLIK